MKKLQLLERIPLKIKQLSGEIFITIIIICLTINLIEDVSSFRGRFGMILFALPLIICIYIRVSKQVRYILCYLSLASFFHVIYFMNIDFQIIASTSFYLPIIYAYLLPDIYSPIIAGSVVSIRFIQFINDYKFNAEAVHSMIGVIFSTIGVTAVFYLIRKITYQRDMYRKLCNTDTLTGVANLNYILEVGDRLIDKNTPSITVYVLDIDHFKKINDTFGHFVGNNVLVQVANVLREKVESYKGIVGRLGGDEFVILVANIDETKSKILLNTLEKELKDIYFTVDNELANIRITVSVGMECSKDQSVRMQELLRLADLNMYYNKQQSQGIVIDKSYEDVLNEEYRRLLDLLCEKDVYTFVHSQYVVQYAVALAEYLGLPNEEIRDITLASWLHDIGKSLVSNGILRKRGKLTEDEYNIIKSHVLWGVIILSEYDLSEYMMEGIRHHHERFDGTGYPYRIKGEDTPLSARIIQIADSFSAMTIKRVYREKLNIEDALKEIERCKGTQFDPFLADKFIELVRKEYISN